MDVIERSSQISTQPPMDRILTFRFSTKSYLNIVTVTDWSSDVEGGRFSVFFNSIIFSDISAVNKKKKYFNKYANDTTSEARRY